MVGSPPRAWGTYPIYDSKVSRGRFTPTCVGNIEKTSFTFLEIAVHPHVRGEHTCSNVSRRTYVGSPPRAWGTYRDAIAELNDQRFTPTCVGNIVEDIRWQERITVHPHVRGEHLCDIEFTRVVNGSPPRAWGTYTCPLDTCPSLAVHPHVRGEHNSFGRPSGFPHGSPPRAWGTCFDQNYDQMIIRFTPTCVGNIDILDLSAGPHPVHPHVRGEHPSRIYSSSEFLGSPPRAWGTFEERLKYLEGKRFTPTCVGNIADRRSDASNNTVHPHVRGEHWARWQTIIRHFGSPPRAWGTYRQV